MTDYRGKMSNSGDGGGENSSRHKQRKKNYKGQKEHYFLQASPAEFIYATCDASIFRDRIYVGALEIQVEKQEENDEREEDVQEEEEESRGAEENEEKEYEVT